MRYIIASLLFLIFFPLGAAAENTPLLSNPWSGGDRGYFLDDVDNHTVTQDIGTGWSLLVTGISWRWWGETNTNAFYSAQIKCFSDSAYTTSCGESATSTQGSLTTSGADYHDTGFLAITPYQMDSDHYYRLEISGRKGTIFSDGFVVLGNATSGVSYFAAGASPGDSNGCYTESGWACPASLNFTLYGTSDDGVFPTSPINGDTYQYNPVNGWGVYNNCSTQHYAYIRFFYSLVSTGSTTIFLKPINQCGTFKLYSAAHVLPYPGEYTWRAQLISDEGALFSTGLSASSTVFLQSVNLVGGNLTGPLGEAVISPPSGTSTEIVISCTDSNFLQNSLCTLMIYLFRPSQSSFDNFATLRDGLANKPPFGYFGIASSTLHSLDQNDAAFTGLIAVEGVTNLLDDGATWLLYLIFAFWLFDRFRHFDHHL